MKTIFTILIISALCLGFVEPTQQNLIIKNGTVTTIKSIGFAKMSVVRGDTNWCDIYYPVVLKDFSVSPPPGSKIDITFSTNVLYYIRKGVTNTIQPEWFTINDGESIDIDGSITKIYLKNGQYRIIGRTE